MVQTPFFHSPRDAFQAPHSRTYETAAGKLLLRDFCPASFVASLTPDTGLRAFARIPEREHQLLQQIAARPDSMLTLAYTEQGNIVGQATLVPADESWQGLVSTYEIAFEVSSGWRRQGIARKLLDLVFEQSWLEDIIIIGMGLSWHWDLRGLGLSPFAYRELIARLFARYGFAEYLTSDENIRMDAANIFAARLGRRVAMPAISAFYDRLLQSDTLPSL